MSRKGGGSVGAAGKGGGSGGAAGKGGGSEGGAGKVVAGVGEQERRW